MSRCRKRVLLVFGSLLAILAVLPPVTTLRVSLRRDPATNLVWKTSDRTRRHVFLARLLNAPREPVPDETSVPIRAKLARNEIVTGRRVGVETGLWSAEAALVAAVGLFDALVFCRRRSRNVARSGPSPLGERR